MNPFEFLANQMLAKLGLSFDPSLHPAENIAALITKMTGRHIEPYEVTEAADKVHAVVSHVGTLEKETVAAVFAELRPAIAEIDPVKAAAFLRAAIHHFGVAKDVNGQIGAVGSSGDGAGAGAGAH